MTQSIIEAILTHKDKNKRYKKQLLKLLQASGWDKTIQKFASSCDFLAKEEIEEILFDYLR